MYPLTLFYCIPHALIPSAYAKQNYPENNHSKGFHDPYRWSSTSVGYILTKQEYMGHTVLGKTVTVNYKGKKRQKAEDEELNMQKLEYLKNGDYFIPNLILSEQPQTPIGKYGRMRKRYLQEYHSALYNSLVLTAKLHPHRWEIDKAANKLLELLMPPMIKAAGITGQLKITDQMQWVGLMNTVKAQVDEIIFTELIYK